MTDFSERRRIFASDRPCVFCGSMDTHWCGRGGPYPPPEDEPLPTEVDGEGVVYWANEAKSLARQLRKLQPLPTHKIDPRPPISDRTLTPYGGYPGIWQREFYRTTGYPYIRCNVKHNADGSKEEAVEEAMTPDGPWYWCDEPIRGATK